MKFLAILFLLMLLPNQYIKNFRVIHSDSVENKIVNGRRTTIYKGKVATMFNEMIMITSDSLYHHRIYDYYGGILVTEKGRLKITSEYLRLDLKTGIGLFKDSVRVGHSNNIVDSLRYNFILNKIEK